MSNNHPDGTSARAVLKQQGFRVGFSSPGRPELWTKDVKNRKTIAQQPDGSWTIVAYPEPSACNPTMVAELAVRDRAMLGESSPLSAEDDLAAAMRLAGLAG